MKKIIIKRKNEYMSGAQTFSFYINEMKYPLDTNSSITINTEEKEVNVYAKLLWMKTRVIKLNPNETEFNITIKPSIDNNSLKIAVLLFFISIVFMCLNNSILELIARILLISMMTIYVYTFTFGFRKYLKLEINKN